MDISETALLFDFYGRLITGRQADILDMYLNEDFSIAEIAENLNVSRQAVHDAIKTGTSSLEGFENKLGLIRAYSENVKCVDVAKTLTAEIIGMASDTDSDEFKNARIDFVARQLKQLLEELREQLLG